MYSYNDVVFIFLRARLVNQSTVLQFFHMRRVWFCFVRVGNRVKFSPTSLRSSLLIHVKPLFPWLFSVLLLPFWDLKIFRNLCFVVFSEMRVVFQVLKLSWNI